jgi:hypothetical protein
MKVAVGATKRKNKRRCLVVMRLMSYATVLKNQEIIDGEDVTPSLKETNEFNPEKHVPTKLGTSLGDLLKNKLLKENFSDKLNKKAS